jgi:hypothetical protein
MFHLFASDVLNARNMPNSRPAWQMKINPMAFYVHKDNHD